MMITILLLVILKAGALRAGLSVTFENPNPCAFKGSSVEFRCSYSYDDGQTVIETTWYKGELKDGTWVRVKLSDLPLIKNRSEYVGDKQHDCSLALHDLQLNDTGYYYFRFDTDKYGRRSRKSVYLSVTELRARVHPDTVRAGDDVTLECNTSCKLHSALWYKDGRPVTKPKFQAQAEDAGKYLCVVEGQESVRSDPVALDVHYFPSIVNLTCSSSANPAAVNYTWFRRKTKSSSSSLLQVGSGQVLSVPIVELSHGGPYNCQARNTVGENNSTEVLLREDDDSTLTSLNYILILVGIGVKAVILLVLPLVIVWAWRRGSSSDVEKEENNCDFSTDV
ncbi:B-cell receptor CD22-like isoform X2 [Notolabrus celidotus]|uniref:B-cell receptor CD22-like isoform X2 n=1 Tax=Notolabrus celidotus TaxID=1203425 RepID=UPI00148F7DA7|nr:B-cell receptor CD22-like isoform X2 [Notolabrus celidotus]